MINNGVNSVDNTDEYYIVGEMCTHKKNKNKCKCYQCLCTGDGSLFNVKVSDLKRQTVYDYFTFHGYIEVVT